MVERGQLFARQFDAPGIEEQVLLFMTGAGRPMIVASGSTIVGAIAWLLVAALKGDAQS
jgi:hypothetical protein